MTDYAFPPAPIPGLAIQGSDSRFPVRRVYCIGRNYADHAREMGHDPDREDPFFFQKNPNNLWQSSEMAYPPGTQDLHHEVELAMALKDGGRNIPLADAMNCVWGYAVSLDMTRRDLQGVAKKAGRPWEIGKAAEQSAPIGLLVPADAAGDVEDARIKLSVNGTERQSGTVSQMIWKMPEIISYLSEYFELAAGDVILTGTPAGVGTVGIGDRLIAEVDGLPSLDVTITG